MRAAFFATLLTFATGCLAATTPVKRQSGSGSAQIIVGLNNINATAAALKAAVATFAADGQTAAQALNIQAEALSLGTQIVTATAAATADGTTLTQDEANTVNGLLASAGAAVTAAANGLVAQKPALTGLGGFVVSALGGDFGALQTDTKNFATALVPKLPADAQAAATNVLGAIGTVTGSVSTSFGG